MSRTASPVRQLAGVLHRRPGLRLAALLSAPLAWLVLAYIGSLVVLLLSAFWTTDTYTSNLEYIWNTVNFHNVFTDPAVRAVALRTLGVAVSVTAIDVAVAFPMAFYMAHVATPRAQRTLIVAVLTPLWAGYLVKAFAWSVMLTNGGFLDWLLKPIGGGSPGFGLTAVVIVLSYLWLPYMILPIYAGLLQLPPSLVAASADLGAKPLRTFSSVILPLVKPAVLAGSVFTFSLSLGDYLSVQIVGGNSEMLGNMIDDNVTLNLPMAAALSCIPVFIVIAYLLAVRRTGALESM